MQQMISILLASIDRPVQLRHCVEQLLETTKGHHVEVVVSLSSGDKASAEAIEGLSVRVTAEHNGYTGKVIAYNEALSHASPIATSYVMVGDDVWARPLWLNRALETLQHLPECCGVVGCNDLYRTDGAKHADHGLITRSFITQFLGGTPFMPCYINWFFDVETIQRAIEVGRYIYAPLSILEHRHPNAHKAKMDDVYRRGLRTWEAEMAIFRQRKMAGFPHDYEPVIV